MPMAQEQDFVTRPLTVSREPVGPKNAASKGSAGDQALTDALMIVGISWAVIALLMFSLRGHSA